jgi:hypothetical protein
MVFVMASKSWDGKLTKRDLISGKSKKFSLLQGVSMSSGAHPAFCALYTVVLFYWANSTGP